MQHTSLAIIGSGPAGYTAGVYASRAQLSPVVFAGIKSGGQLMYTTDVENFPGFPKGVMGAQLMIDMREQAQRFGAKIRDEFVTAVDFSQRPFKLWTSLPEGITPEFYENAKPAEIAELVARVKSELEPSYTADSIVLATGAVSRMVGAEGEHEYLGKGVSTCAVCDAAFYRDKVAYVVGGGDSAMEDTLALTKFAQSVTILHRRDSFRASKIMQDRVLSNEKVSVMWNTTLKKVIGGDVVEKIVVAENGTEKELPADGVFVAIGHIPMTRLFASDVELDPHGYIVTRSSFSKAGVAAAQQALSPADLVQFPSMTNIDGVFAAGDVVDVRYKQAITAAGSGCMAALDAERWLESQE